jgi:glycerol-3-phosphate acyltransferase PlsX
MKIVVDAMGGDHAPRVPIDASIKAIKELGIDIILVGDSALLERNLAGYDYPREKIQVVHASEVITNYDEPAMAVRHKKDSSIVIAANLLKQGKADALLSMGNTGALLAAGLLVVGRIKGIARPAIGTLLPSKQGPVLLIDAGANTNCKPENLVQFGVMGDIFIRRVLGKNMPVVGLISNGEEEGKGDDLTKETYPLMTKAPFHFVGNVEGRDIMEGDTDIIVCDGFVGNVILKTIEGVGNILSGELKNMFLKNLKTKIGYYFVKDGVNNIRKMMDYREYGGAPLLGVKKPMIKGHGSSDTKAAFSALIQAKKFAEASVISDIETVIKKNEEENGGKMNAEG